MLALIIIGILVAIIALIMIIPIGADIGYEDGELRVSAKAAGILLQLIPKPPKDETKPKKEKKPRKPKKEKPKKEKKPKEKKPLNFSKEEIFSLVKKVLNKFGRFGRKFRVERFLLHYVAGGKDPYDVASTFGYVNAALSSLAPFCAKRFDVKDCSVRTDVDFSLEKTKIDFGICVTLRIGAIFALAFGVVFAALGILIKNKFRLFKEKLRNRGKKAEQTPADVQPDTLTENTENNIQAQERKDKNG